VASHDGNLYVMLDGLGASPTDQNTFAGAYGLDAVLTKLGLRIRRESCQPVHSQDTPPPPWAVFRRHYDQPPLMPNVAICAVDRRPSDSRRPRTAPRAFDASEFQGTAAPVARLFFAYFDRVPDQPALQLWLLGTRPG
jgi:hypothetical protein